MLRPENVMWRYMWYLASVLYCEDEKQILSIAQNPSAKKKRKEMWVPLTVAIFVFVFFVKPKTWLVGFLTFLLLRYSRLSSVSVLLLLHVRNNVNICLWIKQFSSWSTWRSVSYCILISAVYWRESGELNLTSDSQCCQSFHQTFDSNAPAKQFITFWKSLVNNRM